MYVVIWPAAQYYSWCDDTMVLEQVICLRAWEVVFAGDPVSLACDNIFQVSVSFSESGSLTSNAVGLASPQVPASPGEASP